MKLLLFSLMNQAKNASHELQNLKKSTYLKLSD